MGKTQLIRLGNGAVPNHFKISGLDNVSNAAWCHQRPVVTSLIKSICKHSFLLLLINLLLP